MNMPLPEYPLKIEGLEYAELEGLDEIICMDPTSTSSLALNTTAQTVLELCDGSHHPEDISRIICEATDGETTLVQKDVQIVFNWLGSERFVTASYTLTCTVPQNITAFSLSGSGNIAGG
ncbi:MAG: PqqD family protein, partial [Flavobacteriales bacterium]